jgi:signal transduction histidine kinase
LSRAFNAMTAALAASRTELIERAESLERSEQHKSELISMVSHEVRTPLASVLGFTRLLLERELSDEDRRRYLHIVDAEATRLASLVSDFLDARLIEEGQFALRREPFDLRSLVREQAELALGHDETHALDLRVPGSPLRVQADRSRLAQVVGNILSNAIKYSPAGSTITVGVAAEDGTARVWVDDEGTGIAPEFQEQIFEPFYRGGAPAAGIPGTGLGLAVSRRIVEAHNGRIGFEALDTGTRFWIDLPLDTAAHELTTPAAA